MDVKDLNRLTGAQAEDILARARTVLLPVGAVENHGPHLPLGTDTLLGEEMARRTAAKLAEAGIPVLVGPAIPFGVSSYHLDFAGSVSIPAELLIALCRAVFESLYLHGIRNVVFIPGHGGNIDALHVVSQELVDQYPDAEALCLNWTHVAVRRGKELQRSIEVEGHGGERETAMVLAADPGSVDLASARRSDTTTAAMAAYFGPESAAAGGPVFRALRSYRQLTRVGSIGDPGLATAELGEALYEAVCGWMAEVVAAQFPAGGAA